jgi:hypothetical protein
MLGYLAVNDMSSGGQIETVDDARLLLAGSIQYYDDHDGIKAR